MKKKWLAVPYIVWMCIFIVIPLFLIGYYAFTVELDDGTVVFSIANMKNVFSTEYLASMGNSLKLAAICTIVCLVIAYPVALILSSKYFINKPMLLFLLIMPMWLNSVIKTYALKCIFDTIIVKFESIRNFANEHVEEYNDFKVVFGMVYDFLPFMIMPIYNVLCKINPRVIEAAQDLGANKVNVFRKVIFPLSLPGVMSGILMVFMPAVSTFTVSNVLVGRDYPVIGSKLERIIGEFMDWHMGGAISLILLAIVLFSTSVLNRYDKDHEGGTLM